MKDDVLSGRDPSRISPEVSLFGSFLALCAGLLLATLLAQADVYAARQGALPVPPILLLAGFAVFLGVLLLRQAPAERTGTGLADQFRSGAPFWVAMIHFVVWGLLRGSLEPSPVLDLRQALFPAVDFFVILVGAAAGAVLSRKCRWRQAVLLAFLLVLASLLIDGWAPGTFSKQVSRAAGLAGNANEGGLRLVLLAAVTVSYRRFRLRGLLILAVCGLAVFLTLSRGALSLFALFSTLYLASWALNAPWRRPRRAAAVVGLVAMGIGALVAVAGLRMVCELPQFETDYGQQRLTMLTSLEGFFQGNRGTRFQLVGEALERIAERPFRGYGPGFASTLRPGPHNQFLKIWMDQGLPGLLLFSLVLAGAAAVFLQRRSFAGLVLVLLMASNALVSHNVMDDRTGLLLLGLLLSASLREDETIRVPTRLSKGIRR